MGNVVEGLLAGVKIPKMFKVKQKFPKERIARTDIPAVLRLKLEERGVGKSIKPGMQIAITAGSRGIANVDVITRTIVEYVREKGGRPFIVAAMGSHGGAASEGQREILSKLGITEASMGCPIKTDMAVQPIGRNLRGEEVSIDKNALEADGIIVSCRIKPHTCFRGPYESGIMKMMAIGLGKQAGAEQCHSRGFQHMAENIPLYGRTILENTNILFAAAVLENAFDETKEFHILWPNEIEEEEPRLLEKAKSLLPQIYVPSCDVLVCDTIGKNFSGSGMDANITGTFVTPYAYGGLKSQRVAILDLSDESYHNGCGCGMAHAATRRFFEKMDFELTYPNVITSTVIENVRIPMILANDKQAIQVCIRTCTDIDKENPKIVRIANSSHVEYIYLSEAYYREALLDSRMEVQSEPQEMQFDASGNLKDLGFIEPVKKSL